MGSRALTVAHPHDRRDIVLGLLPLATIVVLAALENAFVLTQTVPRLRVAASSLRDAMPWWSAARGLAPLVPPPGSTLLVAVAAVTVASFGAYAGGIVIARRIRPTRLAIGVVAAASILAWIATAAALPTLDTDIYAYIAQGRVAAVHGANPEVVAPAAFPDDPVLPFVAPEYRSIPGDNKLPLWANLTAFVAATVPGDVPTVLLAYRVLFLGAAACALGLIAFILSRLSPEWLLPGLVTFGWSPIVVTTAMSKVDTVMAAFVLGAVALLAVGRPRIATISLALSVLVKLITLPLLAVRIAAEVRRRELRAAVADALIVGAVFALVYAPFWSGPGEPIGEAALLRGGGSVLPGVLRGVALVAFAGVLAWAAIVDDGSTRSSIRVWTVVMLFFGAFLTTPGMSWYLLTLIGLAAVVADPLLVGATVGVSAVSFAFDRVQRFALTSPVSLDRGVVYVVAGAAVVIVAAVVVLGRPFVWRRLRALAAFER